MRYKCFGTRNWSWLFPALLAGIPLASITPKLMVAQDLRLPSSRPTRWLELRQMSGKVTYQPRAAAARTAKIRDRLRAAGDKIVTAKNSEAILAFDDNIGSVRVTENTTVQIRTLQTGANGGRITQLSVPQGIARLQVRRLTNPNSRLEVQTPAGVAGVRGTEFGVSVTPNGKTVVATLNGSVATTAQGKTVLVNGGFYSLVVPGQPPTAPKVNSGSLRLDVQVVQVSSSQVRIVAQTDPSNSVFVDGQAVETTLEGKLDRLFPLPANRHFLLVVRNAFGNEQSYDLSVGTSR